MRSWAKCFIIRTLQVLNAMLFYIDVMEQYGLFEIKLGGKDNIEKGATTLNKLAVKIDTDKMKALSFKMALTAAGQFAYKRKGDGVYVVPITCMKD